MRIVFLGAGHFVPQLSLLCSRVASASTLAFVRTKDIFEMISGEISSLVLILALLVLLLLVF